MVDIYDIFPTLNRSAFNNASSPKDNKGAFSSAEAFRNAIPTNNSGLDSLSGLENMKLAVWEKARFIPGEDSRVYRHDDLGHRIKYSDYGNRNSLYGWEMDHYPIPKSMGGEYTYENLRPLHWYSNAQHGGLLSALLNS